MADKNFYEDGKYCIQDFSTLYIGTKFNKNELLEYDEIPFKFRLVTERYFAPEWNEPYDLEAFLFYLSNNGLTYKILKQLKAKVRITQLDLKKCNGIKGDCVYVTKTLPIDEYVSINIRARDDSCITVQELSVSKLALMGF